MTNAVGCLTARAQSSFRTRQYLVGRQADEGQERKRLCRVHRGALALGKEGFYDSVYETLPPIRHPARPHFHQSENAEIVVQGPVHVNSEAKYDVHAQNVCVVDRERGRNDRRSNARVCDEDAPGDVHRFC